MITPVKRSGNTFRSRTTSNNSIDTAQPQAFTPTAILLHRPVQMATKTDAAPEISKKTLAIFDWVLINTS